MDEHGGYWERTVRARLSRRRLLASAGTVGAGAAASMLIGCGDDDDAGGTPASQGTQVAAQPKRGGTLSFFVNQRDFDHHDPHQQTGTLYHIRGSGIVYNRLIKREFKEGMSGVDWIPTGDLATGWEQPDETTYVFKLAPNIKWHNVAPVNGRALTAEDVAYSTNRQLQLKATAAFLPSIRRVTAIDPATVRVELEAPDPDWLVAMTAVHNKVVAREVVEQKGDLKQGPNIGTGAWIFRDWQPNGTIKFVRNPEYFRPGLPYADALELPRIVDQSTGLAAFRTKQVQYYGGQKREIDDLKRANAELVVKEGSGTGATGVFVILRYDIPPTNDIRVRRAINKAVDREAIIKAVFDGLAWVSGAIMAATNRDDLLPDDEVRKMLARDLNGARQLMQQAGLTDWKPVLATYVRQTDTATAELVQAQVKEIGINATIKQLDINAFGRFLVEHDEQFASLFRGPVAPPATNTDLQVTYKTGGVRNVGRVSDAELDRLIDAQSKELKDRRRRRDLLHQVQRKILDIGAVTPIYIAMGTGVHLPQLKGVHAVDIGDNVTSDPAAYELMWLDQ